MDSLSSSFPSHVLYSVSMLSLPCSSFAPESSLAEPLAASKFLPTVCARPFGLFCHALQNSPASTHCPIPKTLPHFYVVATAAPPLRVPKFVFIFYYCHNKAPKV